VQRRLKIHGGPVTCPSEQPDGAGVLEERGTAKTALTEKLSLSVSCDDHYGIPHQREEAPGIILIGGDDSSPEKLFLSNAIDPDK
jgi:hypothetical protein